MKLLSLLLCLSCCSEWVCLFSFWRSQSLNTLNSALSMSGVFCPFSSKYKFNFISKPKTTTTTTKNYFLKNKKFSLFFIYFRGKTSMITCFYFVCAFEKNNECLHRTRYMLCVDVSVCDALLQHFNRILSHLRPFVILAQASMGQLRLRMERRSMLLVRQHSRKCNLAVWS